MHTKVSRFGASRRNWAGVTASGRSGRISCARSSALTRSLIRSRTRSHARSTSDASELRTPLSTGVHKGNPVRISLDCTGTGHDAPDVRCDERRTSYRLGRTSYRRCVSRRASEIARRRPSLDAPGTRCHGRRVPHDSEKLYAEACRVIPGGVNSPVRSWNAVGGSPLFIQRARGAEVVDADGRAYLDLVGSWGPMILGHAHPGVVAAIRDRARAGTSFGAPTAVEIELARLLVEALPAVDEVRLVSSGTEATMSVLRLARAATGRDVVVKFSGCYHGHVDALLGRAGSGALTFGVPDSPGVPAALAALTLTAEFNDVRGIRELVRARGGEIAAVIVEPVAGNMGVVPPAPGFLETLRE